MSNIVHVLGQLRVRTGWMVRCDGHHEIRVRTFGAALEHGRQLARELADRSGTPVTLRIWARMGGPVDEAVGPSNVASSLPRNRQAR